MLEAIYHRRFTVFLVSFLLLIFGDLFVPYAYDDAARTFLLLQNMLFSMVLFRHQSSGIRRMMYVIFIITILSQLTIFLRYDGSIVFALVYIIYFVLISYRIFRDLQKQRVIGIEMISAAFCGYILLGVVSSIIFLTIDSSSPDAFTSAMTAREFPDFLYFSFITLLTIGYGDITPTSELSQKIVIIVSLTGHFYTVFVMAVVIGKFLKSTST